MQLPLLAVCGLVAAVGLYAEEKLGAPLVLKEQTPIQALLNKPAQFVGRTVQVQGKVTDVCQKMGCWMMLTDTASGAAIRIKVKDGEIVFPKESVGKSAVAEGSFTQTKLTRQQAVEREQHEAEENGRKFDPSTVKGPAIIYQLQATGAIIRD